MLDNAGLRIRRQFIEVVAVGNRNLHRDGPVPVVQVQTAAKIGLLVII
jgi:hypothetical protein